MTNYFEGYMGALSRIRSLEKKIKEFQSGERYLKIQSDYHRVIEGYKKEIKKLRKEIGSLHAQLVSNRNMWMETNSSLYEDSQAEIERLKETVRRLEEKIWETEGKCDERIRALKQEYEEKLREKDRIIEELTNRLAHAEALLSHDGTNTGMPTAQTPPGRNKHNPNSRKKTGRKKGGQPGHEKHSLETPDEEEITDTVDHYPDEEGFVCPGCGGENCTATGEYEDHYEFDVKITVKKIRHRFYYHRCDDCGTVFGSKYPPNLAGEAQYGSGVQAMILSLANTVNSAMNKTAMFMSGITGGALNPCEGYVAKLQTRAAKGLLQFRDDLKMFLITRRIVYWDDTVVLILTRRACLRFYGDEAVAYYVAHEKKDMKGIDGDGILALLTADTHVMHDHNTVNYNKRFHFKNIECCQHLDRDLQKNSDDTQHGWSSGIKKLITKAVKDRKKAEARGEDAFSADYIQRFHAELDRHIGDGWKQNADDAGCYAAGDERALLRRIEKYRVNYFMWLEDFSLPTTNNLSERALRGVKSHQKISGQFESVAAADNYALIRTYTETCRRNGINEIEALRRLCEGNPYTVDEIFSESHP